MSAFDVATQILFPAFMLVVPLALVLSMRLWVPLEIAPHAARRERLLRWSLCGATLVSLAAFAAARMTVRWNLAMQVMYLFFPLWFGLAMPLLRLRHPRLIETHPADRPVRSASLVPRELENPLPQAAWLLPWLLWGGGLALLIAARLSGHADNLSQWRIHLGVQLGFVLLPILGPLVVRGLLQEAEPLGESASPEILRQYRSARRFRAVGMFALICLMLLGHSAIWVASAWGVSGSIAGRLGALAGMALGGLGAAIGIAASIWRSRIHSRVWSPPLPSDEPR